MKRAFAIFICIYLLFNTVGFTLYAHFCGNRLVNTEIYTEKEDSCCSKRKKPMDCCKTEIKSVQLAIQYLPETLTANPAIAQVQLIRDPISLHTEQPSKAVDYPIYSHHAPPERCILYQLFRI